MGKTALILLGLPLAFAGLLIGFVLVLFPTRTSCDTSLSSTVQLETLPSDPVAGYDRSALTSAATIMNVAAAMGLPARAQTIALLVAIEESALNPAATSAAGGVGLFGQLDEPRWGTVTDRQSATTSTTNFLTALIAVDGWVELPATIAANRVQGTPDPYRYEAHQVDATAIIKALSGSNGTCLAGDIVMPLSPGFNMTDDFGRRPPRASGASLWHPAVDLQHYPNACGDQIYAITSGTVTRVAGYQVSIKSPDGYTVSYLHMKLSEVSVEEGQTVAPGDPIALVGSEGPSSGCHLDLRINLVGNTNESLSGLPLSESLGAPVAGYVNPEEFYALFGIELCPKDTCRRNY